MIDEVVRRERRAEQVGEGAAGEVFHGDAGTVRAAGDAVAAWAASGSMVLTGPHDRPPLGPPAALIPGVVELAGSLARHGVHVDALALLGERAATAGFSRHGDRSCGGGTRLLRCADAWMAVTLARPADWALVPAWLGVAPPTEDHDQAWAVVAAELEPQAAAPTAERAWLLGLPVAVLGGAVEEPPPRPFGQAGRAGPEEVVVVDLSSLWAGPLCTHLLGLTGARVVKVESWRRPDGARSGPEAFFDLLNAGNRPWRSTSAIATTGGASGAAAQGRRRGRGLPAPGPSSSWGSRLRS